ncbi:hypothetical protein HPB50_005166 [Hyalomma asiaticum]|uniref:Uncharacterized protein n=1 Tax=Hyalomma asiaticum TaxID=266040 RepID=A0ACB7RPF9_HYAAI|nr:hypothetical protein HPB50_005166 [Hyalomma asiaticum]
METSEKARRPKTRLEDSSPRQSPQLPAPDVLPSSRRGNGSQAAVTVVSANREVSERKKWVELLRLEHSQPSPEESDETVDTAPRERPSRAMDASGMDGDISTPSSPYKDGSSPGPDATSPAATFLGVRHGAYSGAKRPLRTSGNGSSGAQSHQWLTPQRSSPLSPYSTESPPRIRVLVASTATSPKAQPYDGFPGVPTYIGAPEVIVFTPRLSPSGAATPLPRPYSVSYFSHQQDLAELSHPIQATGVAEAAEINKRARLTLLQVWVLCASAAGTLSLPLGLFTLTDYPGPFSGVPARCLRPVRLNDPNVSIVSTTYKPTGFERTRHQTFCVFNVSRLGRANSMTPIDMPLDYCSSIVYWSLGVVASGAVESRVEQFDSTDVGLYKWRDMLDRTGLQDTRIMLTVGGYPQESAYFSGLDLSNGRDLCRTWSQEQDHLIGSIRGNGLYVDKICAGFSMAPFLADGWIASGKYLFIRAFSNATFAITGRRATTSVVDVCGNLVDPPCRIRRDATCVMFRRLNRPGSRSSPAPLYIFQGRELMYSLLSKFGATQRFCSVVCDLDADNFRTACPTLHSGIFAGLRHLANVTEDPKNDSYLEEEPPCT